MSAAKYTLVAGMIMRTADLTADLEDFPAVDVEDSEAVLAWARGKIMGEGIRDPEEAYDRITDWKDQFSAHDLAEAEDELDKEFAWLERTSPSHPPG